MKTLAEKAYRIHLQSSEKGAFKRLIETYDLGILAGIQKDKPAGEHILALLLATLKPEPNPELFLSLKGIYHDCGRFLNENNYAAFTESMERLKGLWTAYARLHGKD